MSEAGRSLLLTFEDARAVVEEHASRLAACSSETLDLLQSAGRVLAEPILADRDIPPFPRSTRDGYAVRSADLANLPARLAVKGEIKAGQAPVDEPSVVNAGEAFSIMTGAPVPSGADAVVMVEYTSLHGERAGEPDGEPNNGRVEIVRSVQPGENIVAQGAEAKCGSVLLAKGTRLNEAAVALSASAGKARVNVFRRPRVGVLTTGDEIVAVDAEIGLAQIRNSNSYSLAVQIQQAGGVPVLLPIAPDEPRRLRELIEQGLQSDLLIMTGGVSMGRYDLVEQVLAELHAEFFFTGAKIQPGRPVVFGRVALAAAGSAHEATGSRPYKYFFGLPGNPVSTMVTFELFARPLIEALAGMAAQPLMFLRAKLKSQIRANTGLKRFLPAILSGRYEETEVETVAWHGSGDIAGRSRSNCYLVIPADREQIEAGEWVSVMLRWC
jgi:molybdopterin molybdotransferase